MQTSDPLDPRAVLGAVKAQPGNAGTSRKPSATAGLDRPCARRDRKYGDGILIRKCAMAGDGDAVARRSSSRGSLERLDQRLRGEWLCEIGEASGLKRSLASGGVVVSSHVDDRHGNVRRFETVPKLNA